MPNISIIVPVGPHPDYLIYLPECFYSIIQQMIAGDELFIVDDQAHLSSKFIESFIVPEGVSVTYKHTDWLCGCACAWNFGVALAKNELCLLMGSDDRLLPGCLLALNESFEANHKKDAWYNLTIQLENGEIHTVFNNAAAVTKGLWRWTGGFPPSAGAGGPDALLLSCLMVHGSDRMIQVKEGQPLYWVRQHPAQDTLRQAATFSQQIVDIRNIETARFVPEPRWSNASKT